MMIDLVDNLIDTSPKSRIDQYDDNSFALKIHNLQKSNEKQEEQSFQIQSKVVKNMDCSVGILKYGSGDVYEGQLLNGKRSGQGTMKFINGDIYEGMWKKDQMCDPEGDYYFKNGNHYHG